MHLSIFVYSMLQQLPLTFILGLGEILIVAFFPQLSGYRDAFAFIVLIVILFYKPTGLLGEKTTEKV